MYFVSTHSRTRQKHVYKLTLYLHLLLDIFRACLCLFQLSGCFFGWWRDKFCLKSGEPLSTRMSAPWLIQISWILRSAKTSSQGWHSTLHWKRNKVTQCYKMLWTISSNTRRPPWSLFYWFLGYENVTAWGIRGKLKS